MLTAPDGSILDANPATCRMIGRTRQEIRQEGRQGLIDSSDPWLPVLLAERQRTGRAHGELTARRKDGTYFPVEISSVVFPGPEGEPRTCIIILDHRAQGSGSGARTPDQGIARNFRASPDSERAASYLRVMPQDPRPAGGVAQSGDLHPEAYGTPTSAMASARNAAGACIRSTAGCSAA
jgi:PAS domain S-box-containing protein